MDLLVFETAGRRYALPLAEVREVVRAVAITPLPGAPAAVEGVVNVRGELVPVMDVRLREQLPPKELDPREYLLSANAGGRTVAVRVDGIGEPVTVDDEQVRSATEIASVADHVAGIATLEEGLTLIYDLVRFLSPDETAALADALEVAGEGKACA
jgi:purine-binding chemotaxis protein CheW